MTKDHFAASFRSGKAENSILVRTIAKIQFDLGSFVAAIGAIGEADRRMDAFCQLNDAALNDIGVNRQGWQS